MDNKKEQSSVHHFHRCTVNFEFYVVHTPTNALFINLVKSFNLH